MISSGRSETEMAQFLEARGWVNVWDIYWLKMTDGRPVSPALSTEDAFESVLREAPPKDGPSPAPPQSATPACGRATP